jgi:hypothetical protein
MAVDSRDKRTSAANLPFMVLLPNPDSRITPDDKMMVAGEYSLAGWSSPNSTTDVSDPVGGGYWTNPDNAIDGNTGTYAEETSGAALRAIQFNFDEPYPQVMKIRVWAADKPAGAEENADVDIDYQVAGGETFYALFDGALTKAVWNEKQMPTGGVYYPLPALRITSTDASAQLRIYEVQVMDYRNYVAVGARPLVNGGLTKNTVVGTGLII